MGWTGDSAGNFTVCWCLTSHVGAAQHGYRRWVFVEEIGKKFSIPTQRNRSGPHVRLFVRRET